MVSYDAPISQWTEPMLEGRYAELSSGIAHGEYSGAVLQEAITQRRRVWHEILRWRMGDDEEDEWREAADWERWHYGAEGTNSE